MTRAFTVWSIADSAAPTGKTWRGCRVDPDVHTGDTATCGENAFNDNRGMIGATTSGDLAAGPVSDRNHHEVEAEYRLRNVAVADR